MKKILLTLALLAMVVTAQAQYAFFSTNIPTAGAFRLTTNQWHVVEIGYTTTANGETEVRWYDNNLGATTNLRPAYVSISQYATNITAIEVSTLGFTNYFTNSGWRTVMITNAAALVQQPVLQLDALPVSTARIVPVDLSFLRGVVVSNSLTNVTVVLKYRSIF